MAEVPQILGDKRSGTISGEVFYQKEGSPFLQEREENINGLTFHLRAPAFPIIGPTIGGASLRKFALESVINYTTWYFYGDSGQINLWYKTIKRMKSCLSDEKLYRLHQIDLNVSSAFFAEKKAFDKGLSLRMYNHLAKDHLDVLSEYIDEIDEILSTIDNKLDLGLAIDHDLINRFVGTRWLNDNQLRFLFLHEYEEITICVNVSQKTNSCEVNFDLDGLSEIGGGFVVKSRDKYSEIVSFVTNICQIVFSQQECNVIATLVLIMLCGKCGIKLVGKYNCISSVVRLLYSDIVVNNYVIDVDVPATLGVLRLFDLPVVIKKNGLILSSYDGKIKVLITSSYATDLTVIAHAEISDDISHYEGDFKSSLLNDMPVGVNKANIDNIAIIIDMTQKALDGFLRGGIGNFANLIIRYINSRDNELIEWIKDNKAYRNWVWGLTGDKVNGKSVHEFVKKLWGYNNVYAIDDIINNIKIFIDKRYESTFDEVISPNTVLYTNKKKCIGIGFRPFDVYFGTYKETKWYHRLTSFGVSLGLSGALSTGIDLTKHKEVDRPLSKMQKIQCDTYIWDGTQLSSKFKNDSNCLIFNKGYSYEKVIALSHIIGWWLASNPTLSIKGESSCAKLHAKFEYEGEHEFVVNGAVALLPYLIRNGYYKNNNIHYVGHGYYAKICKLDFDNIVNNDHKKVPKIRINDSEDVVSYKSSTPSMLNNKNISLIMIG